MSEEDKKEYLCPVCGDGLVFTTDPILKKLKAIKCKSNKYDKKIKSHVGCDFIVYSKQKLIEPKVLLKDELKELVDGETLRIMDMNLFIDANNPTIVPAKGNKPEARFYLRIERDEDIEEDV